MARGVAQAATCAPTAAPGACAGCRKATFIPYTPLGFPSGYACETLVNATMPVVQGAAGMLVEAFGRAFGLDKATRRILGGAARVVVGVAQTTAAQRMQVAEAAREGWRLHKPAAPDPDVVQPPEVEVIDVTPARKA